MKDPIEVLNARLERAYNNRDFHLLDKSHKENVDAAVAAFEVAWIRELIHEITGVLPPKRPVLRRL